MKKYVYLLLFIFLSINVTLAYTPVEEEEVRNAEFKVIEKCWGDECSYKYENIIEEKVEETRTLSTSIKTYNFNLYTYYAEDIEYTYSDALTLLTDEKVEKFKNEEFIPNVINVILSNEKRSESVNEKLAREAMEDLDRVIEEIRKQYKQTEIVLEKDGVRTYFIHNLWMEALDTRVFAENDEKKLVAIKTDNYNDVFTQKQIALGGGIVERSVTKGKVYRLGDPNGGNFYLCMNCSKCDICGAYVAYGENESELMVYFSKYCPEHACSFVWKCLADPLNSGEIYEGLECRERKIGPYEFCIEHKCKVCVKPVVGIRINDVRSEIGGSEVYEQRATGLTEEKYYSDYCANHKCMAPLCYDGRIGANMTENVLKDNAVAMDCFCGKHARGCKIFDIEKGFCGERVDINAYKAAENQMICEKHWKYFDKGIGPSGNPNYWPPALGLCAQCGRVQALALGGKHCNECFAENVRRYTSEDVALINAVQAWLLKQGSPMGNAEEDMLEHIKSYEDIFSDDAFRVTIKNEAGEVIYENIPLWIWRQKGADEGDIAFEIKNAELSGSVIDFLQSDLGESWMALHTDCIGASEYAIARAVADAGMKLSYGYSGSKNDPKPSYLEVTDRYEITYFDEYGNEYTYHGASVTGTGACINLDQWSYNWEVGSGYKKTINTNGLFWDSLGTDKRNDLTSKNMEVLNGSAIAINVGKNGKTEHTYAATNDTITYIREDGVEETSRVYLSVGRGDGTTDSKNPGAYMPDRVTFYDKDKVTYQVIWQVNADGEYVKRSEKPYNRTFAGVYGIESNVDIEALQEQIMK